MTDLTRLPTLDELRARRKEAMIRASRRLVPWMLVAVALEAPGIVVFWMVHTARLPLRSALPILVGSAVSSGIWLTALLVRHVKHNLPGELRQAGLVCHVCGEPLLLRPNAAGARTLSSDPAVRALTEGRCGSCKAVVVRDLPALVGAPADHSALKSSSGGR